MHVQFGKQYAIPLKEDMAALHAESLNKSAPVADPLAGYAGRVEGDTLVFLTNSTPQDPQPGSDMAAALRILEAVKTQAAGDGWLSAPLQKAYQQAVDSVFAFFDKDKRR